MKKKQKLLSLFLALSLIAGMFLSIKPAQISAATNPGKPVITLHSPSNDRITVTISKTKNASGYRIYMKSAGDSKYRSIKSLAKKGTAKRSYTIKSLSAGTYYIRVRAYRKNNGKTIWGAYSNSKKIRLKKPADTDTDDTDSSDNGAFSSDNDASNTDSSNDGASDTDSSNNGAADTDSSNNETSDNGASDTDSSNNDASNNGASGTDSSDNSTSNNGASDSATSDSGKTTVKAPDGLTDISCYVTANGEYSNWEGVSNVSQFKDENGNFCFAYDDGSNIIVVKTKDSKITQKITLAKAHSLFGAVECDSTGNYYVVTGEPNSGTDTSTETIFVSSKFCESVPITISNGLL